MKLVLPRGCGVNRVLLYCTRMQLSESPLGVLVFESSYQNRRYATYPDEPVSATARIPYLGLVFVLLPFFVCRVWHGWALGRSKKKNLYFVFSFFFSFSVFQPLVSGVPSMPLSRFFDKKSVGILTLNPGRSDHVIW